MTGTWIAAIRATGDTAIRASVASDVPRIAQPRSPPCRATNHRIHSEAKKATKMQTVRSAA